MIAFIDGHRGAYGVEPICKGLPAKSQGDLREIAPSTYHAPAARRAGPSRLPARAQRDAELRREVERVFVETLRLCGLRQLWREGVQVARCTVARLMRGMGLAGAIRGKPVRATVGDKAAPCPLDRVNRPVRAPAPNRPWVSEFTDVGTWPGFAYVAFVVEPKGSPDIDAFARRIVGGRVGRSAHAGFVLDALEPALHERRPAHPPLGQRGSIRVHDVSRAPGGGWHRAAGGQRRRQWRHRPGRGGQRPARPR